MLNQRVASRMQKVNDFSVGIAADLSAKNADKLYQAALEKGRELSGRALILNEVGVVQIDSFSALNGTKLSIREVVEVLSATKDASYGFHKLQSESGGSFWAAYYTSAIMTGGETIGAVVFSESIEDVVSKVESIRGDYLLIFIGATLLIFFLSYLSTNHISRPLTQLRESAIEISKGNFSTRVNIQGKNEIAQLGAAFNTMTSKLENVDKQRSEFVSNASHELKTPLTSMKILTESILYQDEVPKEVYQEFLGDIDREIDRMTALINDLLLMTKIENDEDTMEVEEASLDDIVAQAIALLTPIAKSKSIRLDYYPLPVNIVCEPTRVRQAVNNLIENAIKYTGEGGIVSIRLDVGGGMAVVSVEDTGEGIEPAELEHIFDRFYRVDKARARETGGTGLGLYIVRKIALNHGGRVEVESEKDVGSVFRLMLPVSGPSGRARRIDE